MSILNISDIHVHGLFNGLMAPLYAGSSVIYSLHFCFQRKEKTREKKSLIFVEVASKQAVSILKIHFLVEG